MGNQKILFVSGSFGLGHVTRDISMVRELRARRKDLEIVWLADPPASTYLREAGEKVQPDLEGMSKGTNDIAESFAKDYEMRLNPLFMTWYKTFPERVKLINALAEREKVDLIVGDETYDIYCEYVQHPKLKTKPFLLILDFIGAYLEEDEKWMLAFYMFQRWTVKHMKKAYGKEGTLFIGELDDISPDKLGFLLPNKREAARRYATCVGQALNFDPMAIGGKEELRRKLGYGPEPLVLVTIGGTAAGAPLLKRAAEAYPMMKKAVPDLKMVIVQGPRVPLDYVKPMDGMEVKGMVPDLYQHMAAADLVISSGGGTTTTELQALNKPFIYFPLEKHFEQQRCVSYHLVRDHVARKMSFPDSDAQQLASAALEDIGKKVSYPKLRIEGAKLSAEHIISVLDRIGKGEIKASG